MNDFSLRVEGLSKSFGSIRAVDEVSAGFRAGALSILAGPDGSGKSTLLRMIPGLVRADRGEIFLGGEPVAGRFERVTSVTGYMPERFSLYTDLSVEENLDFFSDIQGVPRARREELKRRLLGRTGMWEFRKRRAGALSGGMKQKLALSAILAGSPDIIILDEPTTGVDPLSRIEFFDIIGDLKAEGRTIIASTPYLDEAEKGDDIFFFKDGRIIRQGPIGRLKKDFPVRIWRIRPQGAVFELLDDLLRDPLLRDRLYVRGRSIRFQLEKKEELPSRLLEFGPEEVPASLEDIFLFYDRRGRAG